MKYYAIKKGKGIENKILHAEWKEVQSLVQNGFKGAIYKGFTTLDAAQSYLDSFGEDLDVENFKGILFYVDGSFSSKINNYGYGYVCVKENEVLSFDYGLGNNTAMIKEQQIGGELLGTMKALLYAKKQGFVDVLICHDYMGVANHAIGTWKADTENSKIYHNWFQNFKASNPNMKINFLHVKAHSGNDFNEIADGLAKQAVGIDIDPISIKMANKYGVSCF